MDYDEIFQEFYRQPSPPGMSKYRVLEDGRVITYGVRKLILKPSIDKNGYHRYHLETDDGKRKGVYAHQLVARQYIDNPENKPFVNHKDHDKSNNCVDNLEWVTHAENVQYDWAMGKRTSLKGEAIGNSKHSKKTVLKLRELYDTGKYTQTKLSSMFSIPFSTVHVIVKRKEWRHI